MIRGLLQATVRWTTAEAVKRDTGCNYAELGAFMQNMRCISLSLILFFVAVPAVLGQESRSTIRGTVTDAQGAVVAGASVTVTNLATNEKRPVTTNQTGYFEVPLLNAGRYQVAAELAGFKKTVRGPIDLSLSSSIDLNLALQVGNVAESVTVTGEAPMLETSTASSGSIIPRQQIVDLPVAWMNPMMLMELSPGIMSQGDPSANQPWATSDISNVIPMGTAKNSSTNEITIDGATVMGRDRAVGYVPNIESVGEFKMELLNLDASTGHSSGAFVNMSTKSGTNQFHGSLFEQHYQQRWNATPHFTRLAYQDAVRAGRVSKDTPEQPAGRSNQFGGTIGGPVSIPKLFNGRDRAFFFFSYDGVQQTLADSNLNKTVPKTNWRQGDFSDLLAVDPIVYQIYDPRTARLSSGRVIRDPFPGNKGIPVLNPMYDFYAKLYPQPNNIPGIVDTEGRNNYYALGMPKINSYNNLLNRFDGNLGAKHKLYGKWYWSHYRNDQNDWTFQTMRGLQSSGGTQYAKGISADYLWTISGHTIFSASFGATQFADGNENPVLTRYRPSDVGLPAYMDAYAGDMHTLPAINFSSIQSIGGAYPGINSRASTGQVRAGLMRVSGNHTWKVGSEERRYWRMLRTAATTSGQFTFGNSFMRSNDSDTRAGSIGLEWASFMMGVPTGISGAQFNDSGYWSTPWRAFYGQDEIRLRRRMRLTVGLRLEWLQGPTERYNRGVAGGFDFTTRLPFSDALEAAYAKSPIAGLPASQFKVQGGAGYLGQNGPRTMMNAVKTLTPRVGFVREINDKTVLRIGAAWYADNLDVTNLTLNQFGYSVNTTTTLSNDNGLSLCCGPNNQPLAVSSLSSALLPLTNPFPIRSDGTRWETPYGNSLGAVAFSGKSNSFQPRDFLPARVQRWRIGLQRQLRKDLAVEVSYNGGWVNRPLGLAGNTQPVNYLPPSYYSTAQARNTTTETYLNTRVTNPFLYTNFASLAQSNPRMYNYLRTLSFFTSTTTTIGQLLLPYPLFTTITGVRPELKPSQARGYSQYNDLQVQLSRRFSDGLITTVMYTHQVGRDKYAYLNDFDAKPVWEDNGQARPHIFIWTGTYDLPFGKGRAHLTSGPLRHVLSGWQIGWVYKYQAGRWLGFQNPFFYGDLKDDLPKVLNHDAVNEKDIHVWFDPAAVYRASGTAPIPAGFVGFEGRSSMQPAYNYRTFPNRWTDPRGPDFRHWDVNIKREFHLREGVKMRFAVDLLNATNHTNFSNPVSNVTNSNFGRLNAQNGNGRMIQFNLRFQF